MANELGIVPAAFDNTDDKMFLDDPIILIKVLNDVSWTAFKPLGYAEIDKTFNVENEYAEFKSGIPQRSVRKDVISTKTSFECKIKQIQPETIALLTQSVVEDKSTEKRVWMGSELPTQIHVAIILQGETVDGKQVELRIRKAGMSSESIKIALGGKDYTSLDFKADVLLDDDPLTNNFGWDVKGVVETTASLTSADDDITVAVATGIEVGMYAYAEGGQIPADTTVTAVVGTTITLSANATASGTDVAVKFATQENILASDVAYWIFEV